MNETNSPVGYLSEIFFIILLKDNKERIHFWSFSHFYAYEGIFLLSEILSFLLYALEKDLKRKQPL